MSGLRRVGAAVLVAGALVLGAVAAPAGADPSDPAFVSSPTGPGGVVDGPGFGGAATGAIIDGRGDVIGELTVLDDGDATEWIVYADSAPPGLHALQVHQTGLCQAPFTTAGARIAAVVLPPISIAADGSGQVYVVTPHVSLASLADDDGFSLVMHDRPDNRANVPARYQAADFGATGPDDTTKATGDVGPAIGCGIAHVQTGKARTNRRSALLRGRAGRPGRAAIARRTDPTDLAVADLVDGTGAAVGRASVTAAPGGQDRLSIEAGDLPPGVHGLQIHARGRCAGPGFTSTGGRLTTIDLPDLLVAADGSASTTFGATLPALARLLGDDGSSLVVQAAPDNHANIPDRYTAGGAAHPGPDATTRSTGDAGATIACGRLRSVPRTERYIAAVYADLLGREPTRAEVTKWTGFLAGHARLPFVNQLTWSIEARAALVEADYGNILGEAPSPEVLAGWIARLGRPGTDEITLVSQLAGSTAVYEGFGGTPEDFVIGAFENTVGRDPSRTEAVIWGAYLAAGGGRSALVETLLRGDEARTGEITSTYEDLVGTDPDVDQLESWLTFFRLGGDSRTLRASLLATDDFYEYATSTDGFQP